MSSARLPPVVLLREEDRRFSEDLPLHPQPRVLIPEPVELLALLPAQPARTLTTSGLPLLDPTAQRDIGDPKILRQLTLRLIAHLDQTDRLTAELLRIRRSSSRHLNLTFPGLRPEASKCRRKRVKSTPRRSGPTRASPLSPKQSPAPIRRQDVSSRPPAVVGRAVSCQRSHLA